MTALLLALALPAITFAQDEPRAPRRDGPGFNRDGGPGGPGQRMAPPLMTALDGNKDGVIDESEINNSADALRKLDKNADGKLTLDELRPARPEGAPEGRGFGPRDGNGAGGEGERPGRRAPNAPQDQ